jgi:hypothetical protein
VSGVDRSRIYRAVRQRARTRLRSFFWPEPEPKLPAKEPDLG